MAIQFLDNQPITWRTSWATDSNCKDTNEKGCTIYSTNDTLFAQWKQTPCGAGSNILCNTTFINGNAEKITNGQFTSNASGWTLLSGATYDSVNKRVQFAGGNGMSQSGLSVGAGIYYDITFTIGGMTKGYLAVSAVGQVLGTYSSPGTYTITKLYNGAATFVVQVFQSFDGWIDDISIKESVLTTGCISTSYANEWSVVNGTVTKATGTASQMNIGFNSFNVGSYIKLSLTVSGYVAGTLTVSEFGGPTLFTITGNGVYEIYYTANIAGIVLDVTADFGGTIGSLSALEYSNYFSVLLKDTKNLTQEDMSGSITLHEDWVILKHPLTAVDPGCYELCVYDSCGYSLDIAQFTDPSFDDPTYWITVGGTVAVGSSKMVVTYNPTQGATGYNGGTALLAIQNYTNVVLSFTIDVLNLSSPVRFRMWDTAGSYSPWFIFDTPNSTYTGTFTMSNLYNGNPWQWEVDFITPSAGDIVELGYFQLDLQAYVPGQMTEYCSNCIEIIDYPDDSYCTKWVGGTNGEDAFGFHFNPNDAVPFQIGARVRSMMINPKYKGDLKRYSTASGNNIVTRGSTDKVYTLFVDYADEHTHDWLRLAVLSDTVKVGNFSGQANVNFVNQDGDYQPEWPDQLGNWPTAQARIELSPKTGTLFNNNAG